MAKAVHALTAYGLMVYLKQEELLREFVDDILAKEQEEAAGPMAPEGVKIVKIMFPRLTSILSLLFLINLLLTIISPAVPHGQNSCTSMPWTISTALAVLWGVCWMFYEPKPDDSPHVNGQTWGTSTLCLYTTRILMLK